MSETTKIEVDSDKLKAFLDDWADIKSRGVTTILVSDILARNPYLSEIEVTVRLTVEEAKARANSEIDIDRRYGLMTSAGCKLNAACRAKLAESSR